MNITGSNGAVHCLANAKRTACQIRIREHWRITDTHVTCERCKDRCSYLLQALEDLGCKLLNVPNSTVWRIEVVPGTIADVPRTYVPAWIERRLESRAAHANRALKYTAGPSEFVTWRARKI